MQQKNIKLLDALRRVFGVFLNWLKNINWDFILKFWSLKAEPGIRRNIILRVYMAFGLIVLLAVAVLLQLIRIQFVQGHKWRAMGDSMAVRYMNVESTHGTIYSRDMHPLAISVPEYEIHMDMLAGGIASDKVFNEKVDSLAQRLSTFFQDRPAQEYSRLLRDARKDSSRYQLIRKKVSYGDLENMRRFPIFNLGKYRGGLIAVTKNRRILPYQALALRTVGYQNDSLKTSVGIESGLAAYINGVSGKRLMQRVPGGIWVPVNQDDEVLSKNGADVISTIDVNFQRIVQKELKKQLDSIQADYGTAILMETATGEIRAIANYTKTKGDYLEKMNYAIADVNEPGSTFMLASYMSLLEDHKVDTGKMVDLMHGGPYEIINPINGKIALKIRDAEDEGGLVSVRRAFEKSSNIGVVKLLTAAYGNNPKAFTDRLYSWHLNQKNGLQIPGEGQPVIKNPSSVNWNKLQSLAQIAYGYELKLTPLQMLTFYNSIANNGKMVSPLFATAVIQDGQLAARFDPKVITARICSPETLKKIKEMLEGVVTEGTGKTVLKNDRYAIAGKTGTAQIANGSGGYGDQHAHQASFCGYFPAEKPKYTMIVMISNPRIGLHLAAWVAGPVFRRIADNIVLLDGLNTR